MLRRVIIAVLVLLALPGAAAAQASGGRAGGPAALPTARAIAPEDITGSYVAVVSEHWHLRMMVPPKGDTTLIPVNADDRCMPGPGGALTVAAAALADKQTGPSNFVADGATQASTPESYPFANAHFACSSSSTACRT